MTYWNRKATAPLALLFVCLLAYLPLCSTLFSLKNDAFLYNFPNKFFFSEALHAGYLPLWNPYLNYGFPLYADPGFAWWQPLTWFFGAIGYNAYTFTLEVLFYIYVAGLGMYWLGKKLGLQTLTAFAIGCTFMCSGFFIGNLQHINFLTCAAFLPWLTGAWLCYQQRPSTKYLICAALAVYLVCTGGHPAIPIATLYFFALLTLLYYFLATEKKFLKSYLLRQLKLLAVSALLLLPLVLSYGQVLPLYVRAEPTTQADSLNVGFTLPSFISFLLPFGTIKDGVLFGTDVSMRNAYFSLAGFVLLVYFLFKKNKTTLQTMFLVAACGMLLLSAGGFIKKHVYQTLPLLQFIRTNGEFRVFAIFGFIMCIAPHLDQIVLQNGQTINTVQKLFKRASILLAALAVILLFFVGGNTFVWPVNATLPGRLKFMIDHVSFAQTLFVAAAVALAASVFYAYSLRKKQPLYFVTVLVADVVFNSWLLLPVTGVSQNPVARMQAIFAKSPAGFPPDLHQTVTQKPVTSEEEKLIGNWNWYAKKINYVPPIEYPSLLRSTDAFLNSPDTATIRNKPALFLKNGNGRIALKRFTPNEIVANVALNKPDTLVLLQNYYPGWNAWVDEKEATPTLYRNNFIQLPVNTATKEVRFRFSAF